MIDLYNLLVTSMKYRATVASTTTLVKVQMQGSVDFKTRDQAN